jgi:hypothetical protein
MVLSTAHLTKEVGEQLDRLIESKAGFDADTDWQYWVIAERWSDYGWWVWARADEGVDMMPPCLRHVLKFAVDHGCNWILFDCDEPTIDELPWWEH